jgi:hypothetical protein
MRDREGWREDERERGKDRKTTRPRQRPSWQVREFIVIKKKLEKLRPKEIGREREIDQ